MKVNPGKSPDARAHSRAILEAKDYCNCTEITIIHDLQALDGAQ